MDCLEGVVRHVSRQQCACVTGQQLDTEKVQEPHAVWTLQHCSVW